MPHNVKPKKGTNMDETDVQLLQAIHNVEKQVVGLKATIDDSVTGRFKDNERRLGNLESNQSKLIWAVVGANIAAVMSMILK